MNFLKVQLDCIFADKIVYKQNGEIKEWDYVDKKNFGTFLRKHQGNLEDLNEKYTQLINNPI